MHRHLALVRDVPPASGEPVATEMARLGWDIRPLPPDLEAALRTPADLWIIDLGPSASEASSLLRTLMSLKAVVPLLVIVEPSGAGAYEREIENLLDTWSAPMRLIFRPFSAIELDIQSRSVTRGTARLPVKPEVYELGALEVDTGCLRAWYGGVPLVIKHPQFVVLAALVKAGGNIIYKAALLSELHEDPGTFEEGAIRSYVSRLRAVLVAAGAHPECIRTVHGQGYALEVALLERRNETTPKLRRIGNDPTTNRQQLQMRRRLHSFYTTEGDGSRW